MTKQPSPFEDIIRKALGLPPLPPPPNILQQIKVKKDENVLRTL